MALTTKVSDMQKNPVQVVNHDSDRTSEKKQSAKPSQSPKE